MLPKGPILLRDYGMHFPVVPKAYSHHKETNIELLLNVYPDLPFVLIGDASQEDAIIYSHIKNKYPDRIKKIMIREVSNPKNMAKIASHKEVDMKSIHFFNSYEDLVTSDL
jgi:phosphatidate phosphatase APP1